MFEQKCDGCEKLYDGGNKRSWWTLNHYHKLSGFFCPTCYDKISHDSYGKPKQPEDYLIMLLRVG